MEKKNTILLTVIAIATLLVAVVGATFAYFTAQVTTTNNGQNTTEVKTAALASATMDMGSKVTANDVYPGAKVVKSVNVRGSCEAGVTSCTAVEAVISIVPTIPDVFGTDIEWALYKSDDAFACRNVVDSETGEPNVSGSTTTTTNTYKMVSTCKVGTVTDTTTDDDFKALPDVDFTTMTKVISSDSADKNATISVDGTTNDNYYLVVTYKDNGNQNAQQGQNFSVAINFAAKSLND